MIFKTPIFKRQVKTMYFRCQRAEDEDNHKNGYADGVRFRSLVVLPEKSCLVSDSINQCEHTWYTIVEAQTVIITTIVTLGCHHDYEVRRYAAE
jgi:hypothetical protein